MRITAAIFAIALLVAACQQEAEGPDPEVEKLAGEKEALQKLANQKDSSINTMLAALNEIEDNLASIREKEGVITMKTDSDAEFGEDQKERIIEDIQLINGLMLENKQKIDWLKRELGKSNNKLGEFEKLVTRLTAELEEKEAQITLLRDELSKLKIDYKVLAMASIEQAELIDQQTAELNRAFYCFGTFKELKDQGVVTKEGGFIGIGRSEKLTDDFNKRYFTEVDVTKTTEIELHSKKARLVTTHPSGSYEWKGAEGRVDKLIITKASDFWSASKYLVVITE